MTIPTIRSAISALVVAIRHSLWAGDRVFVIDLQEQRVCAALFEHTLQGILLRESLVEPFEREKQLPEILHRLTERFGSRPTFTVVGVSPPQCLLKWQRERAEHSFETASPGAGNRYAPSLSFAPQDQLLIRHRSHRMGKGAFGLLTLTLRASYLESIRGMMSILSPDAIYHASLELYRIVPEDYPAPVEFRDEQRSAAVKLLIHRGQLARLRHEVRLDENSSAAGEPETEGRAEPAPFLCYAGWQREAQLIGPGDLTEKIMMLCDDKPALLRGWSLVRGLRDQQRPLHLHNDDEEVQLEAKIYSRHAAKCVVLSALVSIAILLTALGSRRIANRIGKNQDLANIQEKSLVRSRDSLHARNRLIRNELGITPGNPEGSQTRAYQLGLVASFVPDALKLASINLETSGEHLRLSLQGEAGDIESVATFIGRLERHSGFRQVNLHSLDHASASAQKRRVHPLNGHAFYFRINLGE